MWMGLSLPTDCLIFYLEILSSSSKKVNIMNIFTRFSRPAEISSLWDQIWVILSKKSSGPGKMMIWWEIFPCPLTVLLVKHSNREIFSAIGCQFWRLKSYSKIPEISISLFWKISIFLEKCRKTNRLNNDIRRHGRDNRRNLRRTLFLFIKRWIMI